MPLSQHRAHDYFRMLSRRCSSDLQAPAWEEDRGTSPHPGSPPSCLENSVLPAILGQVQNTQDCPAGPGLSGIGQCFPAGALETQGRPLVPQPWPICSLILQCNAWLPRAARCTSSDLQSGRGHQTLRGGVISVSWASRGRGITKQREPVSADSKTSFPKSVSISMKHGLSVSLNVKLAICATPSKSLPLRSAHGQQSPEPHFQINFILKMHTFYRLPHNHSVSI